MVSRYLDATKVGTGAWRQPRSLAFAIGASDMDDQESKPNVKKLTLVCQTTTAASLEHREMEELAAAVATQFLAVTRNLRMIRPQIERIRAYYASNVRGSIRLAGCSSFNEYCEKKLGRTRKAIYAMLGDYSQKQREKKERVRKSTFMYDGGLTQADVDRMRTALNAINRFEMAKERGRDEEARAAWEEYTRIAAAEPLASRISGDQPNTKLIVTDLLGLADELIAVLRSVVDSGMIAVDARCQAAISLIERAGKFCSAIRRRMNIAGTHQTETGV